MVPEPEKVALLRKELGLIEYDLADEADAKEQLLNTFAWRKENGIDDYPVATAMNQLPVPYAVRGYTTISDSNLESVPGISESVLRINQFMGVEEIQQYHIGCNEFLHRVVMKECSKRESRPIHRETIIFDCTGMGWRQLHLPALHSIRAIADIDQKYYPETINKFFLINAPSTFVYVWKIVKSWLDPTILAKVQILGSNYQEALQKQIAPENLPNFLGGKCTCSHMDGGCVPSQASDENERVTSVYSTEIMEKAKTSEITRGPCFYNRL
ncbi:CRAL/TRIO domain-containing protein [Backusella circina FSU 941]|nr:CRAL/TRIO domain-containing protein [Backusella circina FSU 941]